MQASNLVSGAVTGFLYVLSNPSMPGLVKIGKTNRDPTDRVKELSSATGVPSPFLLVYFQPMSDCDAAEKWAHTELERRGYRPNASREFFQMPVHEAVKVLLAAESATAGLRQLLEPPGATSGADCPIDVQAKDLYDLALQFCAGDDSTLSNPRKAIGLLEQASALGHAHAASLAGAIYWYGDHPVRADPEKALTYMQLAVARGLWSNLASIAQLFTDVGRKEAAEKHWILFFDSAILALSGVDEDSDLEVHRLVASEAVAYFMCRYAGTIGAVVPLETIAPFAKSITTHFLAKANAEENLDQYRRYQAVVPFLHRQLEPVIGQQP